MQIITFARRVLFGTRTLSVIGFTPATEGERRLAPMLGKVQKVCRLIPGSRFDIYVKEGELTLTLQWKPRARFCH